MKGKNGMTIFLPLNMKIGGHFNVKYAKEMGTNCLTTDQVKHIYKKVEGIVNIDKIK